MLTKQWTLAFLGNKSHPPPVVLEMTKAAPGGKAAHPPLAWFFRSAGIYNRVSVAALVQLASQERSYITKLTFFS